MSYANFNFMIREVCLEFGRTNDSLEVDALHMIRALSSRELDLEGDKQNV